MKCKHYIKILIICLPVLVGSGGCSKFEEMNTDPDASSVGNSAMLATTLLLNVTRYGSFTDPALLGKYLLWTEMQRAYQYNQFGEAGFDRITILRNVEPMVKNATTEKLGKSYKALGHFISAWQFYHTTMMLGDIPYTDAVKGASDGVIKPVYDEQKKVFLGILNELDQANTLFPQGSNFSGDMIYNGDVLKWQKLVNSFQLHVLLQLWKKTGDADLKVAARFADVATRPLMTGIADNFALTYSNNPGQNYPWSNVPAGSNPAVASKYTMLGSNLINPLKALQDKRLFYFAAPSARKITDGLSQSDYNAYVGVDAASAYTSMLNIRLANDYSDINQRYILLVNAEPQCLFSYWDTQFALAEGAVRGWITGTPAQTYYANGIMGSMNFVVNNTPDNVNYHHNMKMDAAYILAYPATAAVALAGTAEQQIEKIITQKYLANFFHKRSFDSWMENRRTGYPVFTLNPASNLNIPATNFPLRWRYTASEIRTNIDNLNAALTRQYGGSDDWNLKMWILK